MDTDWTASALFSPSKARVQQAQAKDWAAVDAWLVKRYGSRLPNFERNEDTLQALLALATLNENADEQRSQVERIEKTALQSLSKPQSGIIEEVYQAILVELVSETHVDTLAETLVALDCPTADASQMAGRMVELTASDFDMNQQLKRAEAQLEALNMEQVRIRSLIEDLNKDDFQIPSEIAEKTVEWTKTTKQLRAKIAEYEERLGSSRPATAKYDLETFQRRSKAVENQRVRLTGLNAKLKAFRDLPINPRAARQRVEEERDALRKLTAQRDRLFESLVEAD